MGKHISGESIADVLANYDFRSEQKDFIPIYCVKIAGEVIYTNRDTDVEASREMLERALAQVGKSSAVISICYYRKLDKNEEPTGTCEIYNARLNPVNDYASSGSSSNSQISALESKIDMLNGKIAELEAEDQEDEDEEEEDGWLSGISKSPEFKQYIMQMLFQNMGFTGAKQGYQQTSPTINGVEPTNESDKIRTALKIIAKHTKSLGDDLMKLAEMSESNPQQFQFLLSMLRK